jgi:hypothetical protein
MIENGFYGFGNGGIVVDKVNDFDFMTIKKEVEGIKKDFNSAVNYGDNLIGQLKKSYALSDSRNVIEKKMLALADKHDSEYNHLETWRASFPKKQRDNLKVSLDSLWVNFQERYEFQPIHDHAGVFSFIIFYEIPYDIETEQASGPGNNAVERMNGLLEFHYADYKGDLATMSIPADKKWSKTCILFPAKLKHSVTPFYSSTDYRITISGNLAFEYATND